MTMPKFEFIAEGHRYLIDGNEWSSVTQVIPKSPHMKNNEDARDKGEYVHEMSRLYLLNDLDEEVLVATLRPYLHALKKFLSDSKGMGFSSCVIDLKSGAKVPTVELQIPAYIHLANNGLTFGDCRLDGPMYLETPLYDPTFQFTGTPDIILGPFPIKEGHALYLKPNGKYSLKPIENNRRNFEMFLQFLNVAKWKKERGLI